MENQPPQEAIVFENEKKEISETRNLIKPKLYINSHWMIPFNIFFCVSIRNQKLVYDWFKMHN